MNLQDDSRVSLNCTFRIENNEEIRDRDIRWQKQNGSSFEDVAIFSPPGGKEPYIDNAVEKIYNNRTDLVAPNNSLSAIMTITNLICDDEGVYRCWIHYFIENIEYSEYSDSSVIFTGKEGVAHTMLNFSTGVVLKISEIKLIIYVKRTIKTCVVIAYF